MEFYNLEILPILEVGMKIEYYYFNEPDMRTGTITDIMSCQYKRIEMPEDKEDICCYLCKGCLVIDDNKPECYVNDNYTYIKGIIKNNFISEDEFKI